MRITQKCCLEREFENRLDITCLTITEDCDKISYKAFQNCKNLSSVRFEHCNKPIVVEMSAFNGCNKLVVCESDRPIRFFKDFNIRRLRNGHRKNQLKT